MTPSLRLSAVLAALALVVAACGSDDGGSAPASTSTTADTIPISEFTTTAAPTPPIPADYAGFREQPTACGADQPPPLEVMEFAAPDDQSLDPDRPVTVVLTTSCGNIVIDMDPGASPETVNSFVFLAREGYFDGGASHRISPSFLIQAGDPTATGFGGPGYAVPDEYPEDGFVYERGVVAMANAGPGSTGSQFFIMVDDSGLPPTFSVLGKVVEGLDVVDRIAIIPLGVTAGGEPSVPLETLYLERVTVSE
jgi:cyclophilin family peptidyl-prolyl cis-trans isomerase